MVSQYEIDIKRCIAHALETNPVRKVFWHMDDRVKGLVSGIRQGDDGEVVGRTVYNMEGPYPLDIGMKTGLIHTCSDIYVMGAKPLYGFDSMQVSSVEQAVEVAEAIKKQADGLGVPIIGGNTQLEQGLTPCASFLVVGELQGKPVPDSTTRAGDAILMLGEVIEGETGQRLVRAKRKFISFLEIIKKVDVHASKDASRGGWFGNLLEMMVKARLGFNVESIPYPRFSRYMGTFLLAVDESEAHKVVDIAAGHECPVMRIGRTNEEMRMTLGRRVLVNKAKMGQIIRASSYKRHYCGPFLMKKSAGGKERGAL